MKFSCFVVSLLLCTVVSVANTSAPTCKDVATCRQFGEQNFLSGNLKDAEIFFQLALKKKIDGEAAFGMGATLAEMGEYEKALGFLKQSCSAGYEKACPNIAGTQDLIKSFHKTPNGLLKHWVSLGNERMGREHFEAARLLFSKACAKKFYSGCTKLGEVEDLLGDKSEAKRHFIAACKGKDYEGCRLLGIFEYRAGNFKAARKQFEHGCANKHYASCGFLGGTELKAGNTERGVALLDDACKHNNVDSCESLAFHFGKLKDEKNIKPVVAQLKNILKPQCDSGKTEACRRLASFR